jgi:signal peptidase II
LSECEQHATLVGRERNCFPDRLPLNNARLKQTNNGRIAILAAIIFALDQLTKLAVIKFLPIPRDSEIHVLPGFFKLVHWHNPGAAWSLFQEHNWLLAVISFLAVLGLALLRNKFGAETTLGSIALGLIFGGIVGNLLDRLVHHHVIDFLYFHLYTRSGRLYDFPAFNVADSAICIGVGLLFVLSWRSDKQAKEASA